MSDSKNKLINHAQINWSDQLEPISTLFDDVYFNTEQGIDESFYVFFQGNNLSARWLACQTSSFSIAESGFGTGLNFLVTCLHFQRFLQQHPDKPLRRLYFSSFEKYPLSKADLINALQRWPSLTDFIQPLIDQYPLPLNGCQRITLDQFNITLDLWFGDIEHTLPTLYRYPNGLFDCWYLDGFAPSKNPEMWSSSLFTLIAQSCKPQATLATFTAAGFVRRGLSAAGFNMCKRPGYGKKREMLIGTIEAQPTLATHYANHFRNCAQTSATDIAIIGGGIASACLALALVKRGYQVTLYCKNSTLAEGASGNRQGALYPLLNAAHDSLSQFFANSFLFARNYVEQLSQTQSFAYNFSGLLQLYYDPSAGQKLDKILQAGLPSELVNKVSSEQTDQLAQLSIGQSALYYPLAGWLNPAQLVNAIFAQAKATGQLQINLNAQVDAFSHSDQGWQLAVGEVQHCHPILVLATAMDTLNFTQAVAVPLSAARGQVTHIPTTAQLSKLKMTLCHEGYLTPAFEQQHCMGATFTRHHLDSRFSAQEQRDNKHKLAKCIPDQPWVDSLDCEHSDANIGIRCMTRDHFPYVGALADYQQTQQHYADLGNRVNDDNAPFYDNLFLLTGLGSRGLCTAPLLAEMLASQIAQQPLPFSQDILNSLQTNRQWVNYLKKGKQLKM